MPLIQELPTAKASSATPGWAYVPDTGFDPSKAPIVPSGARSRNRKVTAASGSEISARQQHKIDQHLASLDRENHKDVQIVVPNRPKDVGARGIREHMTPGVRKILQSQKTFANHLADEEAAIALREEEAAAKRSATQTASKKRASAMRQSISNAEDIEMPDAQNDMEEVKQEDEPAKVSASVHPLLKVDLPPMPSAEEIEALLSAPPLSYNAARSAPSTSTAPPRQFCEICGYWGRSRCMKCGTRVCGLECQRQHEDSSCQKFWA